MAAKKQISDSRKVLWPKFEKPLSQRKFFNKINSKMEKHEFHIFEIKVEKKVTLFY